MKRADPRLSKNFKNRFGTVYFFQFFFGNFKRKFFIGSKSFLNNFWGEKWVFFDIKNFLNVFKQTKTVQSSKVNIVFLRSIACGVASLNFTKFKGKIFFSYFVQNAYNSVQDAHVKCNSLVSIVFNRVVKKTEIMQSTSLCETFSLN